MFALLTLQKEEDTGLFGAVLRKINPQKLSIQTVQTPVGSYLHLLSRSEKVDWCKVARLCGRSAAHMVLPQSLSPPENCAVKRYVPTAYRLVVLQNTCVQLLKKTKVPLYRKTVTLFDREGRYSALVRELLFYCMTVRVVTQAQAQYEALSYRLMEELGAGLILTQSNSLCEDSLFILAPDSAEVQSLAFKAPVFTIGSIDHASPNRLLGDFSIALPQETAALLPYSIHSLDFAGALFEFCRWHGGDCLAATHMRCKQNRLAFTDVTKYFEQSVQKKGNFAPIKQSFT